MFKNSFTNNYTRARTQEWQVYIKASSKNPFIKINLIKMKLIHVKEKSHRVNV